MSQKLKKPSDEERIAFAITFAACDIAKELQAHEITKDNFRGLVRFECSQWLEKHRRHYSKPMRRSFYEVMLQAFSDAYDFDIESH